MCSIVATDCNESACLSPMIVKNRMLSVLTIVINEMIRCIIVIWGLGFPISLHRAFTTLLCCVVSFVTCKHHLDITMGPMCGLWDSKNLGEHL